MPLRFLRLLLAPLGLAALAAEPTLLATMGGKASVSFGARPVTMAIGDSRDGVKLVAVGEDNATFLIDGKRKQVRLGQSFYASGSSPSAGTQGGGNTLTLFDAGRGHFLANLAANGGAVRGMIDTGATFLSLSAPDAARLGVRPDRSKAVRLSTAQGTKIAWLAKVTELKLEHITLYNVDAVVSDGGYPEMPLIGMSVLNQLNLQRDGDRMTLKKKY
ncbi:retropepsin-like aspartic protease family protein [Chitinimonas koreensis]|uniref:retropepsin-like aspartic protease family protein n=1 Tax=Chitinimonas koreensis TaxID=356302 RepID=UPI000419E96A|nr:TIGR02281 family clan AA aspartic protease [Chitinimonas koreensis]QNM96424.1 TIGR02281 family clan AA aspartic protease [Chitinimonas koreensis]